MERAHAYQLITEVLSGIAPEVDPATVDPGGELQVEFDLDSLDFLNLVEGVCKSSAHNIPELDYPAIGTLDAFVEYLSANAD